MIRFKHGSFTIPLFWVQEWLNCYHCVLDEVLASDILRESQNLQFSPTSPDKELIYRPDTLAPAQVFQSSDERQMITACQSSACGFWLLQPCTVKPPHCSVWETLAYLCHINGWNMFGHVLLNSRLSNEESETCLTSLFLFLPLFPAQMKGKRLHARPKRTDKESVYKRREREREGGMAWKKRKRETKWIGYSYTL